MSSILESMRSALAFMPQHRQRFRRSSTLTLDALLDDFREQEQLLAGSLDFILMGYRYTWLYESQLKEFRGEKTLAPPLLTDLWQIAFAALLTRTSSPQHALVTSSVELAREIFGPQTAGITNAFLRGICRKLPDLLSHVAKDPSVLLGPILNRRWDSLKLKTRMGRALLERPPAGVSAFDSTGCFGRYTWSEFTNQKEPLQAMDLGSWLFCEWLAERVKKKELQPAKILDACAAPGGKLISLHTLGLTAGEIIATDSKLERVDRLRKNLLRWKLSKVKTSLVDWEQELNAEHQEAFAGCDLILIDLPCSGSGTLHTRPDLLMEDMRARVEALGPIQANILSQIMKVPRKNTSLVFVSICSVDPMEIATIRKVLKLDDAAEPSFFSFDETNEICEGITGWLL